MAPILWYSFGTIAALLQEIVSIYPLVSTPRLTPAVSNRCCNALALLQCVASHTETRRLFLNSQLGLFLYPFLNTRFQERHYEYLRLTSLGVIGALVKVDDPDVINFLLNTEIIPLCLSIMSTGKELSQTVATFIIQKILVDELGLGYVCATYERFDTVSQVLSKMVQERPSTRLLKHIVRCYLRLSDNPRACDALRHKLPDQLRDNSFPEELKDDQATQRWLHELLGRVGESATPPPAAPANSAHHLHNSHVPTVQPLPASGHHMALHGVQTHSLHASQLSQLAAPSVSGNAMGNLQQVLVHAQQQAQQSQERDRSGGLPHGQTGVPHAHAMHGHPHPLQV